MLSATYKDLCIDAADPVRLGAFWGAVLGWDLVEHDDGDAHLADGAGRVQLWLNRVPEPRSIKNRLHLDVRVVSVADVLALGATLVADQPRHGRWTVLHDPDGQELCVFVQRETSHPFQELAWDAGPTPQDEHRIATWWADLLGAQVETFDGFTEVQGIDGAPFPTMAFAAVPEPRTGKNRVHLDLVADVGDVVAHGATLLRPTGEDGLAWHVLADPDGNVFCVFVRGAA